MEKGERRTIDRLPGGYPCKTVELTQGYSRKNLKWKVHKYEPGPKDKQHWFQGDLKKEYKCAPYTTVSLKDALQNIENFVKDNIFEYIDSILPDNGDTRRRIARLIFMTALEYAKVRAHATHSP